MTFPISLVDPAIKHQLSLAGGLTLLSLLLHPVLQRRACKDLHFFDLRGSREQFVGPSPQRLRNLASEVRIATRFICKGVEDPELPRPDLDRIPFQGRLFIQREWLI